MISAFSCYNYHRNCGQKAVQQAKNRTTMNIEIVKTQFTADPITEICENEVRSRNLGEEQNTPKKQTLAGTIPRRTKTKIPSEK
jgi:hypothetical protein